jgi:hypothetical protein
MELHPFQVLFFVLKVMFWLYQVYDFVYKKNKPVETLNQSDEPNNNSSRKDK